MKKLLILLTLASVLVGCSSANCESQQPKEPRKIAVQMYTFHKFTLEDSIPLLKKAGITGLGLTAGQDISAKYPKLRVGPHMNAEQKAFLKKLIADNGCQIVSFGVTGAKDEAGIKAMCEFAKEMGIPILLTEAPAWQIPLWDKYCGENGIKMAIHNHAADNKANNYYDPRVVKNLIKDCKNVYACPDNGHWSRAGIDSVFGYKTLEGKIAIVHFKDQKEFGNPKNQCVPFGTGALDMTGMLAELDRQGFDGYYLIEYEAEWDNPLPSVVKCYEYLKKN